MKISSTQIPCVVDLDGTLIRTDLLLESINLWVLKRPWRIFQCFHWFLKGGRLLLKTELAKRIDLAPEHLPYHESLMDWLQQQKKTGCTLILATASYESLAQKIAAHLKIFDQVFASHSEVNLKAEKKRDLLVQIWGEQQFDYIGNSTDDLIVWKSARKAYLVSSSQSWIKKVKKIKDLEKIFPSKTKNNFQSLLLAMRVYQWIKNHLIFVPLIAAHRYWDRSAVTATLLAWISFSSIASSVYILNDLVDLHHDRQHPDKKHRPFASGYLPLSLGWFAWPLCFLIACWIAWQYVNVVFLQVILFYFIFNIFYSFYLKRQPLLDVLSLAMLYTFRIFAGSQASSIEVSSWLLAFSLFFFSSLAFLKRFTELFYQKRLQMNSKTEGRGYQTSDLEIVSQLGITAGYLAILVLALYIQDPQTRHLYASPQSIILVCPLLIYWISRYWFIAHRGDMQSDPILFAIKDFTSWTIGAMICLIVLWARL